MLFDDRDSDIVICPQHMTFSWKHEYAPSIFITLTLLHAKKKERLKASLFSLAEGEGFELSGLSSDGFQDRCNRPLCHPSK